MLVSTSINDSTKHSEVLQTSIPLLLSPTTPDTNSALSKSKESIAIELEPFITDGERYTTSNQIEDKSTNYCCFKTSIPPDGKKTLLAFFITLITIIFSSFIITVVDERIPNPKHVPPLPDLILDYIEEIPWVFSVTEVFIILQMAMLILVIIFHRHKLIVLRRLFSIIAALYFLRSITMILTSLPISTKITDCEPKTFVNFEARLKQALSILFGQGLSSFGVKTCGDYFYSGHTCTLILAAHFIQEYSPNSCRLIHCFSWFLALIGMFCILASHQHYSIDILIAWVLSSLLFIYYHTLANNRTLLQRDRKRMRLFFPFFSYFEENVKTAIPNEYCVPGFIYQIRLLINNWLETIRYSVFFLIILFCFIVISCFSSSKTHSFSSIIER